MKAEKAMAMRCCGGSPARSCVIEDAKRPSVRWRRVATRLDGKHRKGTVTMRTRSSSQVKGKRRAFGVVGLTGDSTRLARHTAAVRWLLGSHRVRGGVLMVAKVMARGASRLGADRALWRRRGAVAGSCL